MCFMNQFYEKLLALFIHIHVLSLRYDILSSVELFFYATLFPYSESGDWCFQKRQESYTIAFHVTCALFFNSSEAIFVRN